MNQRPEYPHMIIVGGTGRNTGKTSLICQMIEKYSASMDITGLKVSSIVPGEDKFHGDHTNLSSQNIHIFKETDPGSSKDTSRMLRAGAREVWFLTATDDKIMELIDILSGLIDKKQAVICESSSLAKFIKPGLLIMMKGTQHVPAKQRAMELMDDADLHLDVHQGNFDSVFLRIARNELGWFLSD
jgi:molybdopterin-guanine dinucleotide biosynthesis protein